MSDTPFMECPICHIEVMRSTEDDLVKRIAELEAIIKEKNAIIQLHQIIEANLKATIQRMEQSYLEGVTYEYYKAGEAK